MQKSSHIAKISTKVVGGLLFYVHPVHKYLLRCFHLTNAEQCQLAANPSSDLSQTPWAASPLTDCITIATDPQADTHCTTPRTAEGLVNVI